MIRLGEKPFLSIQGEGARTGRLSVWVRFFGCNLCCNGFGQKDPTDPLTYELPYKDIDVTLYKSMADLPVFEKGCDSGYSWAPKFKKLALDYETKDLVNEIMWLLPCQEWQEPITRNRYDLCFTGGEPMLHQVDMINIMEDMAMDAPDYVQVETNGTTPISPMLSEFLVTGNISRWHWNVSPKLFYVSGEPIERAWKPEAIVSLFSMAAGCLKFVVNNDPRCWDELNDKVAQLRSLGVDAPVFVMPVGATKDSQENIDHVGKIARRAIQEGYHVSGRLHATLFGNGIGT